MNTNNKGQLAVLKIQQRAMEKDFIVSIPTTESVYDLLIENNGKILKIQCKYGDGKVSKDSEGSVRIEMARKTALTKYKHDTYSSKDIDLVLVYVPKIDKILCFGPEQFENKRMLCVRIEKPKNGQKKNIKWANDFIW